MKRALFVGWLLLVLGLAPTASAAAQSPANAIVAIVDDEVITWKDVQQETALAIESKVGLFANRPAQLEKEIQKAQQEAVEILVERKLILQEFKRIGYNLPDSLIEDRVRERLRELYGGDRAAMARDLQAKGLTPERFRQQERERFIVAVMRSKNVFQEIVMSPFKIEKYYKDNLEKYKAGDQVKLRTIMLNKPKSGSSDAARKRAEEILTKLDEGASFAEMATVYSEDTFRSQGGSRGWVELEREHYVKELDEAIRALRPGQRSGVLEAGAAYWIILLEDTKLNHTKTLPEVRQEIEQTLLSQERARLDKQWIDKLKAKTFLRYF
jgi:peptidyl-prolyl cis-trans isomerase SurA